jgi:SAM-dependent methyltransferase
VTFREAAKLSELNNDSRFPRTANYDQAWLVDGYFGANPLWLAEWLAQGLSLGPAMRVLDLGCGRAKSSIFLAKEFGVSVWAADLWVDPSENWARIKEAGLESRIHALRADARDLSFPKGFFDAIVAIDSYQYFGTDDLFLPYVLDFLRPEGILAFASAGVMQEVCSPLPEHLQRFWDSDTWCIHSADWWRKHWSRTNLVEVKTADTLQHGWSLWLDWAKACRGPEWYVETMQRDRGEYLGYIRLVAQRRIDAKPLPYNLRTGKCA